MKAERRHELKTNTLARGIDTIPQLARQYGNKVLLGLILILALFYFFRHRQEVSRQNLLRAQEDVDTARRAVDRLRNIGGFGSQSVDEVAKSRNKAAQDASTAAREALDLSDDPDLRAQAYIILGDLNWRLANFPDLPGATTRPDELGLPRVGAGAPTRDDLLKQAESAYGEVLRLSPPNDRLVVTAARLSLAAVAENRRSWDGATRFYQEVIDDPQASKGLKEYARQRLKGLDDLRKPPLLAVSSTRPAEPATRSGPPAVLGPPMPATLPASETQAMAPTTSPATQP